MWKLTQLCLLIAIATVLLPAAQAQDAKDAQVIEQLKKAGSNLKKPHDIEFFLYFKKKESAQQAGKQVASEGCKVIVEPGAGTTMWLCDARKRMVPALKELVRLRKRFEAIAKKYGGEYDGWETAVVK